MPLTVPSSLIVEMNKLDTPDSIYELVEVQLSEASTTLRYVIGNTSFTWGGSSWTPWPIQPGPKTESLDGELPTVSLQVSNVGRVIQGEIEEASNGLVGDNVIIRAVHSAYASSTAVYLTLQYQILEIECDPLWCTFKLGCENFYFMQFPRNIMKRNRCRYKTFKGNLCGYGGAVASCDRTLDTCITLSNSSAFGGFPGIPGGGFDVSS